MTPAGTGGRLLLLVPTTSYRIGDFLDAAARLGITVAVGSGERAVLEDHADGATVAIDFADAGKGVADIAAYAARYPLRAIVATDEETTVLAARASAALGLAHNSPESVEATGNKYRFRAAIANSGLPAPRFRLVGTGEDPAEAAREASYPCVLKPLAMSGGRGVIRADNADQFAAAFRRIAAILGGAETVAREHILVEDYIPGDEVALEGLLRGGRLTVLALFDKPDPLVGPTFEETLYVTPSRLAKERQRAVADAAGRALSALGLSEGPVHVEMRLNGDGVWLVEAAARSIGGQCSRALRFGGGSRLEDIILRHALGLPVEDVRLAAEAAGVMMIPIPRRGILRDVAGLFEAKSVPGIADVTITGPTGHEVVPLPEGNRYLGFIFARGREPADVEAALRQAHGCLSFTIEAPPAAPNAAM